MQIKKVEYSQIEPIRSYYLKSLYKFQDYFLELMIEDSVYFLVLENDVIIGYSIKTTDNILIEFFVLDVFVPRSSEVFKFTLKEISVKSIYCKSFDSLLLSCCTIGNLQYKVIGALFRDFIESRGNTFLELEHRFADETDIEFLLQQEDETFEPKNKMPFYITNKNIILFNKNNVLAGCGFITQIHKDWNYYDLGVWVEPSFRRQGIAAQIISYLKLMCLENNWNPVCGCAVNNSASIKTLEKNGFLSRDKLIEFRVGS